MHMKRFARSVAAVLVLVLAAAVAPATIALASPMAPANCVYIDNVATQQEITGAGPGNPVVLTPNGNCFSLQQSGTYQGHTWYEYQTPGGYCLQRNGSDVLIVGSVRCPHDTSHPSYQMFGVNDNNGWSWSNPLIFNNGGGSAWMPDSCSSGSHVSAHVFSNCARWFFP
jgi:hypothetical protein